MFMALILKLYQSGIEVLSDNIHHHCYITIVILIGQYKAKCLYLLINSDS